MPSWKKVILSGSGAALNSLNVSTSLTASGLIYPITDGTPGQVLITDGAGNLSFSPVENTAIVIKNVSGVTIQKGTPCYITGSGTSGNLAGVWPADAGNPLRMPAGVIAGETLIAGAEGVGLINGYISNVNTSAFVAGESIYVAVGGGYTNIKPTGSSVLIQKLGNVEKSHPTNGSGVINGPAYYNEVPNIQQGFTWVGNSNGVAIPIATSSIQNVISSSNALTASFITGSNVFGPFGSNSIASASFAISSSRTISASFASTASFVNTLNQNVLITGSLTVGSTTAGASENTLTLGPSPAGGSGEGGQLGLNAQGGTYTSASFIDNWQNHIRILRGTNASSDGLIAQWNLHSKQMNLSGYTSPTAIPGTVSGLLAFDTSGNIITTTTGSGGGGVTINNNTDNYIVTATGTTNTLNGESGLQYNGTSLAVTGQVTASGAIVSTANGAMYFRGGDDAEFWDINVANTVGIYGQQNADRAGLKLGSSGPTLFGSASRLGIGTITPTLATLEVNGNVWANSFTGSLFGTASWANNATTASFVTGSNVFGPFGSNSIISASFAVSSSRAVTSSFAVSASFATTASFAVSSSRAVTASFALTASTSNQTAASVTFNDGGAGDASGTSFNGSTARTVSFNTVGAPSTSGTNAYGTWDISISGNATTATTALYSEKYTFGTFKFSAGNSISFLTNRSVSSGGAWQSQYSDLTVVLNYINYLYVDIYDEVDNKLYSRRTFADLASFYSYCSSQVGSNSGWASFYAYTNDTSGLNIGGGNVFSTAITPKGTPTGKNKVRSKRTYAVNFSSPAVGALETYLTTNLVNDLTTAFGSTIANQLITNAKVTEIVNNNLTNFIIINKYKKRDLSNFYAGDLKMSDGSSTNTDINTTKLLATVLLKYDLPNQLVTYQHASLTYNVGKNSFIPYSPDTDTSYFNLYIMVDTQNTEFRGLVVEPISIDVATIPFNAILDEPEVSYQYFAKWGNKIVNIAKVPRVDSIVRYEMVELGGITSSPSLTKQRNEITLVRLYNNRTCDVFEDSLYIANSTYNANYAVVNKIKLVHYKLVKK